MAAPPLLERADALRELRAWNDEAAREGRLVLLRGEAGIGKTSLVDAFAAGRGRVWRGACEAMSTPRPFAPLLDLGTAAGPELTTALASGSNPVEVFGAVLAALSRRPGQVLVVEDLHWADDATVDLVRYLARRLAEVPALVVVTYRDDEIGPDHPVRVLLGDLASHRAVRRLDLPALSREAVAQLAGTADVDELWASTGGNPFFVTEVLATGGPRVPATVRDAVLTRVTRLPGAARDLLEAAAVLEPPVDVTVLRAAAGVSAGALDRCVESGILGAAVPGADGSTVAFRHELARRALLSTIPPGRWVDLHRRVLDVLEDTDTSPATLAHHAEAAGARPATRRHAERAAVEAARLGAHQQAADQYGRALRALPPAADAERADLLVRCSLERALGDHTAEATADAEEALRLWRALGDRLREGDTLCWLARLAWMSQRNDDADRRGRAAVALLEELPPGVELARARATVAQHLATFSSQDEAQEWGHSALVLAEALGAREIAAQASIDLGLARALSGDPGGTGQMRSGIAAAVAAGSDDHAARGLFQLVRVACQYLRHDEVDACAEAAEAFCAERGVEFWGDYARAFRAQSRMHRGQWDAAAEDAASLWRTTTATSPAVRSVTTALTLGLIRLRRGSRTPTASSTPRPPGPRACRT
ncbi:ATP-binding protein [Actinomycetospora sp. CA-053990]|uniref:ATP-binding protein n=1 Tax=Actinomycetospora sp. CA-053990 TaxID=3239891 RepID=UPI003D9050FE